MQSQPNRERPRGGSGQLHGVTRRLKRKEGSGSLPLPFLPAGALSASYAAPGFTYWGAILPVASGPTFRQRSLKLGFGHALKLRFGYG